MEQANYAPAYPSIEPLFVRSVHSNPTRGRVFDPQIAAREAEKKLFSTETDRFLSRTRYFTGSGIIGSKEFVRQLWL